MPSKKHKPEEIISKLREVEIVLLGSQPRSQLRTGHPTWRPVIESAVPEGQARS